jgi:transposase-like protein
MPISLLKRLTAALVERAMGAEMTHHLGYEAGEKAPEDNRTDATERGVLDDVRASQPDRPYARALSTGHSPST